MSLAVCTPGTSIRMLKLLRTSIMSAAAAWGWRNRSTITEKVKDLTGRSKPEDTSTGYAETVDADGMMSRSEFEKATNA